MIVQSRWWIAATFACALVATPNVPAQTAVPAEQLRFDVASIKRNVTGNFQSGPSTLPSGEVRFVNMAVRTMVLRAYPVDNMLPEIIGLPSWADSDRYDILAKGKAGATSDEQQQMWNALLTERMKLAAHYEMRERPSYNLMIARPDRKLGAGLKPSTLDCAQSAPPEQPPPGVDVRAFVLQRCKSFWFDRDGTMSSGGVAMDDLARMLSPTAGRIIVDRTGLAGLFAVTLRYQRGQPGADAVPSPDDPPSLMTALGEQLGLKLEADKTQAQVLVVDHIEQPDPD